MNLDLGIDLGTANLLVCQRGKGIVLRAPSVLAVCDEDQSHIVAVGEDARQLISRSPETVSAICPVLGGVIADYAYACKLLQYSIDRVCGQHRFFQPRALLSVPGSATSVERHAVFQAAREAGARDVALIEVPMAAALGAGMDISLPTGRMIISMGAGRTDIAVLSMQGIVAHQSTRSAGVSMDGAIARYVRRVCHLEISLQKAEEIKTTLGSLLPYGPDQRMEVLGNDLLSGQPASVEVSSGEIRPVLRECFRTVVESVRSVLREAPAEIASDIIVSGIYLCGGGSMLRGADRLLSQETRVSVSLVEDPVNCVAIGLEKALDRMGVRRHSDLFVHDT